MSSTTVSYSSTTNDVALDALRAREERARQAMLLRISTARNLVASAYERHSALTNLLDRERAALPDLLYIASALPPLPSSTEAEELEDFARTLNQSVDRMERDAHRAVATAKAVLRRRKQLARAWSAINDTLATLKVLDANCRDIAAQLGESFSRSLPTAPATGCTLEQARAALASIEQDFAQWVSVQQTLQERLKVRRLASRLSGEAVSATTAGQVLEDWHQQRATIARQNARERLESALVALGLSREELPSALRDQVDSAVVSAGTMDYSLRVVDLIHRHGARLAGAAHATRLLACTPEYLEDGSGALGERWHNLVARLEAVLCGHAEWSESLAAEHRQIHEDRKQALQKAYAKAAFIESLAATGVHLVADDGELAVMDIVQYDGYYLEQRTVAMDDGYAVVMELKKDGFASDELDEQVTEEVCRRLAGAAAPRDAGIRSGMEVIERKKRVTRARRPGTLARRLTIDGRE